MAKDDIKAFEKIFVDLATHPIIVPIICVICACSLIYFFHNAGSAIGKAIYHFRK